MPSAKIGTSITILLRSVDRKKMTQIIIGIILDVTEKGFTRLAPKVTSYLHIIFEINLILITKDVIASSLGMTTVLGRNPHTMVLSLG